MIITISGTNGSGKNTISDLLAEKFKLKRYSVGNFRREMAKKMGLTIHELNKLGEKDISTDKPADDWQIEIGKKEDNFVIDGRLSYHFIPNSIKIFLDVRKEVGASRIMNHLREEEKNETKEQAEELWQQRYDSDTKRYKKYYNLNPYDKSQYDLVIDTSDLNIPQVLDKVLEYLKIRGIKVKNGTQKNRKA